MNQTYQIIPHSFGEPEYREIKGYTVKFVGRSLLFQSSRFWYGRGNTKTAKTRTASTVTDTDTDTGTCLLHDLTELEDLETLFKKVNNTGVKTIYTSYAPSREIPQEHVQTHQT